MTNQLGEPAPQYQVEEKPVWNDNFIQLLASDVPAYLAANAGARPREPDPVDDRIVSDWQNGTGSLINFETDVGGFPDRPSTARAEGFDITENDRVFLRWQPID